jgi:hypothetical protein
VTRTGRVAQIGLIPLLVAEVACGGPATPSAVFPQVAGMYTINRTVVANSCDTSTTSPSTTATVTQATGSDVFTLTDLATVYHGRVSAGGSFVIEPLTATGHDNAVVVVTFQSGRFTPPGFTARVTIDVGATTAPAAPACQIVQDWTGVKQGAFRGVLAW